MMINNKDDSSKQKVKKTVNPSKRIMMHCQLQTPDEMSRLAPDYKIDNRNQNASLICEPNAHDVLCGRGNYANNHEGNLYFRGLVKSYKMDYISSPKPDKKIFSKMIYERIRQLDPPGRFLKYEPNSAQWTDIGEKKAIEKTRQALREGAPDLVHSLSTRKNEKGTSTMEDKKYSGKVEAESLQSSVCNSKISSCSTNSHETATTTWAKFPSVYSSIMENHETCVTACTDNEDMSSKSSQDKLVVRPHYSESVLNIDAVAATEEKDKLPIVNYKNGNEARSRNRKEYSISKGLSGPRIIPKRYF